MVVILEFCFARLSGLCVIVAELHKKWLIQESDKPTWIFGIGIELLVFYAARLDWKNYQIAGFPVVPDSIYHSVATTFENKENYGALMDVFSRVSILLLFKYIKSLDWSVWIGIGAEVTLRNAHLAFLPGAFVSFDYDGTVQGSFPLLFPETHTGLVRGVAGLNFDLVNRFTHILPPC